MEVNEVTPDKAVPLESADKSILDTLDLLHKGIPLEDTNEAVEISETCEDNPLLLGESAQELFNEITSVTERSDVLASESERGFSDNTNVLNESAEALGLDAEEERAALNEIGFAEREASLRERLSESVDRLKEALKRGTGAATTAFVLGIATPAFAETPTTPFEELAQNTAASVERVPLPTYEEAKKMLRDSTYTASTEEMAIFARMKDGEPMKTIMFKKGGSVSVSITNEEYEQFIALMKSRTAEIESVHTHPISAQESVGLISKEQGDAMRRGEMAPSSNEPSVIDWGMLLDNDTAYNFPSGQISYRVIDPTGEWEYGVRDSGSPFIRGIRKANHEAASIGVSNLGLTDDEKAYLKAVFDRNETTMHGMQEILNGGGDTMGFEIRQKLLDKISPFMTKNVSAEDLAKYSELTEPLSASMNAEERLVRVHRMQEIATALGFRLSYTPHSAKIPE